MNVQTIHDSLTSQVNNQLLNIHKLVAGKTVACFDIETTSLEYQKGDIIEIGVIKVKFDDQLNAIEINELNDLIKVPYRLEEKTIKLTGITDELLASQGITKNDAFNHFIRFTKDVDVLVHQNGNRFDMPFVSYHLLKHFKEFDIDHELWSVPVSLDTMEISRQQYPKEKTHKLEVLCERYNVPYDGDSHHRAIYDTRITLGVFIAQLHTLGFEVLNDEATQSHIQYLETLSNQCDNIIVPKSGLKESQIKAYVNGFMV